MGPIREVSIISENSTCLATEKQDEETRGEGGGINQWCSFHKSTAHSDVDCRIRHGDGSANAGNANYAAIYIEHPVSFTAVEAPTEEEAFWPFGPTDEPVDTSGLIGFFGGVRGEEADDSLLMVEEKPTKQLGF